MDEEFPAHQEHISSHPWKARFVVGIIMIVLSFVGLILSNLSDGGAEMYWKIVTPLFAILSIWLSCYLRRKGNSFSLATLVREVFHLIAMLLAVFLFCLFVKTGTMGKFAADIAILTTLALTLFIAGIYIEPSFIFIGIAMGLFSAGASYMAAYLYTALLPIAVLAIIILFVFAYFKRKKAAP